MQPLYRPRHNHTCRKCGQEIQGPVFSPTLKVADPNPITVRFCQLCFQEALCLNSEEMEQYLAERRADMAGLDRRPAAVPPETVPMTTEVNCRPCGMSVTRLMIKLTLNSRGASPIHRIFCPSCFQTAMKLSDLDMAYYLNKVDADVAESRVWQLVDDQ